MITEDYVSFEVAKLLQERGFYEDIDLWYDEKGCIFHEYNKYNICINWRVKQNKDVFQCPTLQMAMKWLREKGIYITIVYGDYPSLNKVFWTPQIDSLEGFDLPDSFYKEYDKYEGAVEAALKYCLENLI